MSFERKNGEFRSVRRRELYIKYVTIREFDASGDFRREFKIALVHLGEYQAKILKRRGHRKSCASNISVSDEGFIGWWRRAGQKGAPSR